MTRDMRAELTPQQYIRQLFAETKAGKMSITYHYQYDIEEPYTRTYDMDWTAEDAQSIVDRYDDLTAKLCKFASMQAQLQEESPEKLLTPEELRVWETFLKPFAPFEVEESVIGELYLRGEYDTLDDEENELLERHWRWRERNSLERMPFLRRSPADVILRARRYARLVELSAPEVVIQEEGRYLAEEMVLYYYGPQEQRTNEEE